jgi:hypothetical protein
MEALRLQFILDKSSILALRRVAKSPSPFSQNRSTLTLVLGLIELLLVVFKKGV